MDADSVIGIADLAGITVFAASGALAAARKSMDIFGFIVIAMITAVGGGTVRDVTLGTLPVFWIEDNRAVILALAAAIAVFLAERHVNSRRSLLTWLDAAGLALFAAVGAEKALAAGTGGLIATVMGIVTAVFGGIIRDVICNELPLILQREIYATAAFVSALTVVVASALGLSGTTAVLSGTALGFATRAVAIRFNLSLPAPAHRTRR